tara:strand:- start:964 stop:2361 length:1398 start_codon:yes stop_codon:yes gene_type:complete
MPEMMNDMSEPETEVPNLMKVGEIPVNMDVDNDTETLDPVVNNNNFCRFVLSNKGFLHSGSKIQLCVDTGSNVASLPVGIGIYSLIQRCRLSIGTHTVSETDDLSHLMGYRSMFIEQDKNKERETYLTSRIHALEIQLDNSSKEQSNTNGSDYRMDTIREPVMEVNGIDGDVKLQTELDLANAPEFSVSLEELFPILKSESLPLYMIDEQVSIELHFSAADQQTRGIVGSGVTSVDYPLDTTKTKLIADYIYYPNDVMEAYKNRNQRIDFTYKEYRLNKRSFTQAQLQEQQVFDIGGAGRVCTKVITAIENLVSDPDESLLSKYRSMSPSLSNGNNGRFITNLYVNDHRLYPIDRENIAVHYHDIEQAERFPPQVHRQEFAKQGSSLSSEVTYFGTSLASSTEGFAGNFFYPIYALNRNERINSKGLQIQLQYTKALTGSFTHRAYLELIKTATLEGGKFRTDFA